MRTLSIFAAAAALIAVPGALLAHHSYSAFDMGKEMRITGIVRKVEYVNPHAWTYVEVGSGAKAELWAIESGGPNILARQGWRRDTVKPGDRVQLLIHPMRDRAKRGGSMMGIVLPNGKTIGTKF